MTTIEQDAQAVEPAATEPVAGQVMEEAVEAAMGKVTSDLASALGVLVTSLGTRHGLWQVLAGAGPLTVPEVAAQVSSGCGHKPPQDGLSTTRGATRSRCRRRWRR